MVNPHDNNRDAICILTGVVGFLRRLCYELGMKKIIQAHIYKGEQYYTAECIDLPVVTQGATLDGAVSNLPGSPCASLRG